MIDDESFFFEDDGIDPSRIVNDEHRVANEFFCGICQGLLWKPKSCASCQHLFCNKCIRTWLKINPTACPFRCSPYEEKRAPPYIHSLLGRLSIRCRNSSFGCTEILSYDSLEQHETVACQFLTKQCRVCGEYILKNEIDQHQMSCIPTTIRCTLCQCLIDRASFQEHMTDCFQERLDLLIEQIIPSPDTFEPLMNNPFTVQQNQDNGNWFIRLNNRLQQFLSAMPKVNLIGFERVVQARQQNSWARIRAMLQLILLNKSRAAQILVLLLCFGIGGIIGFLICLSLFVQEQVRISMYRSFIFIILFSGIFNFCLPILFTTFSDTFIIGFIVIGLLLWSSACSELPLDNFQICPQLYCDISVIFYCFLCFQIMSFNDTLLFLVYTFVYISRLSSLDYYLYNISYASFLI